MGGLLSSVRGHIRRFFFGSPEDCRPLKIALGFPVGLGITLLFYFLLIEPLRIAESFRRTLGTILGFGLAIGFAFSTHVRCMIVLLVPVFFSKEGRAYVGTFSIALLVSGPIANIMANAKESTRALSCTMELLSNNTKSETEFRLKPLQNFANQLQEGGDTLHETMMMINAAFGPIRKELLGQKEVDELRQRTRKADEENGWKYDRGYAIERKYSGVEHAPQPVRTERKYQRKLDFRCEDVFTIGVENCKRAFRDAEQRCMDKLPAVIDDLLCWPMKITAICELVRAVKWIIGVDCNSVDAIDPGLGEAYDSAEKTSNEFNQAFKVDLKYKAEYSKEPIDVVTAEQVGKEIMREFETKEQVLNYALNALQLALGFAFVLLFMQAYNYSKSYVTNIHFDNIYATAYFKKIDSRRARQGKATLLPLKRLEAKRVVEPTTPLLRSVERSKLIKGSIRLLINVFFVTMVIAVDQLLYGVLDIIQRHSRIEYSQRGEQEVEVKVVGTGFAATIVRNLIAGLNTHGDIDKVSTNFHCLPRPSGVPGGTILLIYVIYLAIWVLLALEAYGLRFRRLICAFFFRKREKSRVLYLYNDMLKRRKGFLTHVRRVAKKKAKRAQFEKKVGLVYTLRRKWPKTFSYLKRFNFSKYQCLVCSDYEGVGFHLCETKDCDFGYCPGCWTDIDEKCYACVPPDQLDLETDDSEDTSADSD